jgi:hypothetical protein
MKKAAICWLCSGLFLLVYEKASAEMFKWVDDKGVIHISDFLPKHLKDNPNILNITDRRDESRPADGETAQKDQGKSPQKSGKKVKGDKKQSQEIYSQYDYPEGREVCISLPSGRVSLRGYEGERDINLNLRKH